jgi:hypothetical protein
MRLTPNNVQSVLGVYPEKLFDVLPEVFSKLLEPDQDELVLQNYAVCTFSISNACCPLNSSFHCIGCHSTAL